MTDQVDLMVDHPTHPLKEFYQSVFITNPTMAALICEDVLEVALNNPSFGRRTQEGRAAAERLRQRAIYLTQLQQDSLETALVFLGYS